MELNNFICDQLRRREQMIEKLDNDLKALNNQQKEKEKQVHKIA